MRSFTEDDFPITASGHNVYRRTESSPICICSDQQMAEEIAQRLNADHAEHQYPAGIFFLIPNETANAIFTVNQPFTDTMAAQPEKPSCFDTSAPKRQP